jgi:hypothetical protein
MTSYAAEKGENSIDISPLFDSETWPVAKVLHEDLKLSISPSGFLDIKVLHNQEYAYMNGREANYHIDYKHMKIILDEEILDKGVMYEIFVYADMNYVNSRLATIESFNKRITSDQLSGTDIHSIDEQNRH